MAAPAVGWVTIVSADPPLSVTARLGDERPDVSSGFGGWEAIERPRRKPLTSWKSAPGLQLVLPIVLDGWTTRSSVERDIDAIEQMGQPLAANREPPQLRISSTGGAVPYQGRTWVLGDLSFGDALMDDATGNRLRQFLTLTLWEYVEDRYLIERSAANRRRSLAAAKKKRQGAKAKRIVAKRSSKGKKSTGRAVTRVGLAVGESASDFGQGEDLATIAARELGDPARWVEIAQLNGLRDPQAITPGQVLRLP
jgi:hypothetical protein